MKLDGSTMRKAVAWHKTAEGDPCIRAVLADEEGNTRFAGDAEYRGAPPDSVVAAFDDCPVCGRPFAAN